MTEEELSIQYFDVPASVRAVRCAGADEERCGGSHAAQGLLDFGDLVKVLALNPHGYPKLPNLQPVTTAVCHDLAWTDGDGEWTICHGESLDLQCAAPDNARKPCPVELPDLAEAIEALDAATAARSLCAVQRSSGAAAHAEPVDIEVVVDSGSDASCLPMSWGTIGQSGGADSQWYRDAQGNRISGREMRTATIEIAGVKFREHWLLSSVTQPLFCVGKLMKRNGWDIIHDADRVPHLTSPDARVRVPLFYKNYSLHAKGFIRGVTASEADGEPGIRALEVSGPWLELSEEFHEVAPLVYARRDFSGCFVDCSVALSVPHLSLGVQYRTTLVQDGSSWNVIELNQDLSLLEQPEAEFEPKQTRHVITIASCDKIDVDVLFNQTATGPPEAEQDANMSEAGLPEFPAESLDELLEDAPAGGIGEVDPGEAPIGADASAAPDNSEPARGHIVVDGVELHEGCNLKTLRAACKALGIGQSGGKATVLSRIASHLDKLKLLERHQVQHDSIALQSEPRQQAPVASPTPEQIRLHCLNHIPYQPWCEHCIKFQESFEKGTQLVSDALGGKALSTLQKRYGQLSKYVTWCNDTGCIGFPLSSDLVRQYTEFAVKTKGHGSVSSNLESFNFAIYVLGVFNNEPLRSDPVLTGRARRERLNKPPRRQARSFLVAEVLHLEGFLASESNALLDRFAAGCMLFAIFARARLGDLKSVSRFTLDLAEPSADCAEGFLECYSYSHKTKSLSNALGFRLPLVAHVKGLGPRIWGLDFLEVARQVDQDLLQKDDGSALLCVPTSVGSLLNHPIKNEAFVVWINGILKDLPFFGGHFTGHTAKSTLLPWLAKWGGSEDDRAILGHHMPKSKSVATYSRDLQAGPLRVLWSLLCDVRSGAFLPDCTRSGRFVRQVDDPGVEPALDALPGFSDGALSPDLCLGALGEVQEPVSMGSEVGPDEELAWYRNQELEDADVDAFINASRGSELEPRGLSDPPPETGASDDPHAEGDRDGSGSDSESSSSSSSSSSSTSADEKVQAASDLACRLRHHVVEGCKLYQHCRTKTVHRMLENSSDDKFVCGRPLTKDHRPFRTLVKITAWDCKQCAQRKPISNTGALVGALAAFEELATECGLSSAQLLILKGKGVSTMSSLAYAVTTPGVQPTELALRQLLDTATPEAVSVGALSSIRRCVFECQTCVVQQLKLSVEGHEGDKKYDLPPAERTSRIAAQKTRLVGFELTGAMECAYSCYTLVGSMLEADSPIYLEPHRFITRQQEVCREKPKREIVLDGGTKLTVRDQQSRDRCQITNELQLWQALTRRSLACDLMGAISFQVQESWHRFLFDRMAQPPPPRCSKVSMEQLLRADRQAWVQLAETVKTLKRDSAGVLPLDAAFPGLRTDPAVLFNLLPLRSPDPPQKTPNPDKGNGKGLDKGIKRDSDGQPRKESQLPDALKNIPNLKKKTSKGKRLCWAYNIKDRGCSHAEAGKACRFGLHLCMRCEKPHPQFECPAASVDASAEVKHPAEEFSLGVLTSGTAPSRKDVLHLSTLLPFDAPQPSRDLGSAGQSWTTGLYTKGGITALRSNVKSFPFSSSLLFAFIRTISPSFECTSAALFVDTQTALHRDSYNAHLPNLLIGVNSFSGGQLWLEGEGPHPVTDPSGAQLLGQLHEVASGKQPKGKRVPPLVSEYKSIITERTYGIAWTPEEFVKQESPADLARERTATLRRWMLTSEEAVSRADPSDMPDHCAAVLGKKSMKVFKSLLTEAEYPDTTLTKVSAASLTVEDVRAATPLARKAILASTKEGFDREESDIPPDAIAEEERDLAIWFERVRSESNPADDSHEGNPAEQGVEQLRQLTGYARTEAHSPFEIITGRPYLGKLVNFCEVVYARVKSSIKGKARWVQMISLGKLGISDLHFGATQGGFLISSRSVRRLPKQFDANFLEYVHDMPWTQASFLAGQSGQSRLQKSIAGKSEEANDQAKLPEVVANDGPRPMLRPEPLVPDDTALSAFLPPPPLLISPGPPTPLRVNPSLGRATEPATPADMLPALSPVPESPAPMLVEESASAGGDAPIPPAAASSSDGSASTGGTVRPAPVQAEPPARKRLRLDAVQTDASGNQLFHQDEEVVLEGEVAEEYLECADAADSVEYESEAELEVPSCLIRPFSESEPICSPVELDEIDAVADAFEFQRLSGIGVISEVPDRLEGHRTLTTKSVRTWRPKVYKGSKVWLRRSRLVAREYAHLDPDRPGLFCPTTNQIMLRVIPALFLRRREEGWSMLALDVSDAFLQCSQQHPTVTRIRDKWFKLWRMLPGQRDGSVTWYNDFTNEMKVAVGVELLPESPALFRLPSGAGGGYVHVDDMLAAGQTERRHILVSPTLLVIEPDIKYLDRLMQVTGLANAKERYKAAPFPTGGLPTELASDRELDAATASRYRSGVGILAYMSSDLVACQFAIRYLTTYSHSPTEGSWKLLRHVASYINCHRNHVIGLSKPVSGKGLVCDRSREENTTVLEVCSDSDWSGCKRTRKSVSSCAILWDNMLLYAHSKTQKTISLSSAESEYNSLVSAAAEGIFLSACIRFLLPDYTLEQICLVDNSACRALACRQGVGKMRHISGKLLWLQQMTKDNVLSVGPIPTAENVSDLGTKPLKAERIEKLLGMIGIRCADSNYGVIGESYLLSARDKLHVSRVVKQGALSTQQIIQVLAMLLQVDRVASANDEPNTQNAEDALSQDDDNLGVFAQILEWFVYMCYLVRDFALEYPTGIMLIIQLLILIMLCCTLLSRNRVAVLRQQADSEESSLCRLLSISSCLLQNRIEETEATSMALPEDIDLLEDDVQEASVEKLSHEAVPFPVRESVEEASSSRDCAHRAKKARASVTLGACFRDVVNFNLVETDAALEEVKWTRALEMWLFVIMEDSSCSAIGSRISRKNGADAMKCLRELFGKKASSTVAKRGSAMQKFVVWVHKACPGECALPITSKRVDDYIEQLQEAKVRPGSFTSFTEAVNFSVHVVGLPFDCDGSLRNPFSGKQLFSPWARGAVALEIQKKAERRQSAVLTTDSVLYLEAFLSDEDEDLVDRYAAGCMLFGLFSRSRISDLRKVKDWILDFDCLQSHGQGFLECSTRSHKTEKDVAAIGLAMPLVAPAVGLGKVSWAVTFSKVASAVGLGFVGRPEGPLLPAPDVTGGWLSRSVTTSEAGAWLCKILDKGGQPSQGITGHSLKSTTLTWACKFGFDKYSRLQLGHHATGEGTLHTYGRDYLAPALRRYDEMLAAIRNGTFFPDLTRSGRVRGTAQVPKVEVSDDEVPDPGLTSFASEGSFEAIGVASAGEKSDEDQVAAPADHELSSSDSSSSQDEVVAGRDHPDLDNDEMACAVARPKPSWEPGYVMYKHVRTQVVHLCAQGSSTGVFACGRKVTSDFKEVAQTKFLSFRKCKTCEGAKPLRDPGALAEAVNAMMQRKSAAESL
ncbi:RE1 [Symbiodinium sp. CCMP2592]|nr:RE1 [Symbiodinium sp. CCMP2592]